MVGRFSLFPTVVPNWRAQMTHTIEISDELKERIDKHIEEGESYEEFFAELLSVYETEGTFLQEGYSE